MTPIPPSQLQEALTWRYATKVFDPLKKIPAETWSALEEALVLSPSSYGLQPWKFIIVQDPVLREKLLPFTWKQRQVVDCSHFVVMTVKKAMAEEDVDAFITRIAEVRGGTPDALLGYRNMMIRDVVTGDRSKIATEWAKHQAYIALGNLMTCAALVGVDTCPMEGFEAAKYDEILDLAKDGLTTAVLLPLGYRSEYDRYAELPKVRFETTGVVEYR
ncbi:MAG: nitroreductase [Verrucomicrobiaceae bacterium]|nr:nitroreductase [Verrucomicrobiaceae bacterium]